jgi:Uma2 family endonuclease
MALPAAPTPERPPAWTADRVRRELVREDRAWPRYEFVDGEVLVTPAPLPPHWLALKWLYDRIDPYVRAHDVGHVVLSPADIALEPDSIVQPDLFVLPPEMLRPGQRSWSTVTALLLAVEVLSAGSRGHDRVRKRRYYLRNGVPEYWIVDGESRTVERWRPEDERPEVLDDGIVWQPRPGLPSLALGLPALFDAAYGPVPQHDG